VTPNFFNYLRDSGDLADVPESAPLFFDHCFGSDNWNFQRRKDCFDAHRNTWICRGLGEQEYRFKDGSNITYYKLTDINGIGAPVN